MLLLIAFTILTVDLRLIPLDGMSLERARVLSGQTITVSLIVAKPVTTLIGRTMLGAADRDDDVERGTVLLGKRFDVKEGKRLVVRGTMRTIYHPPVSWVASRSRDGGRYELGKSDEPAAAHTKERD